MGGNTFGHGRAARIPKSVYHELVAIFTKLLDPLVERCQSTQATVDKEDFGDLDLVVVPNNLFTVDKLKAVIEASPDIELLEYQKNHCLVKYKDSDYQVDIMTTGEEHFELECMYNSYSIIGPAIGIMCYKVGLSFSPKGLYCKHFSTRVKDFSISKDINKICRFLGLDYKYYCSHQFSNNAELFKWLKASRFYKAENFAENNSKKLKNKNKHKRMEKFIQSAEEEVIKARTNGSSIAKYLRVNKSAIKTNTKTNKEIRRETLLEAVKFFSIEKEFEIYNKEISQILEQRGRDKEAERVLKERLVDKFNPTIIEEITSLDNKQLGLFYKFFIDAHPKQSLVDLEPKVIRDHISKFFETEWEAKWTEVSSKFKKK